MKIISLFHQLTKEEKQTAIDYIKYLKDAPEGEPVLKADEWLKQHSSEN